MTALPGVGYDALAIIEPFMPQSVAIFAATDDPRIATLTLNRPDKRNALSIELMQGLRDGVERAGRDLDCRVLIFRAAGPSFCAGLDLAEAAEAASTERSAQALFDLYLAICHLPLVTIAAVQGHAQGGGAGLLAACDIAVGAEDLQIGFPEVRRGLVAALVTCLCRRQLGDRTLRELTLLGRSIGAQRALSLGLVERAVARDALDAAAFELAAEACLGAPGAIVQTKRELDDVAARPIAADLRRALESHLTARHSTEAAEGSAAFRQKRAPRWGPRPPAAK